MIDHQMTLFDLPGETQKINAIKETRQNGLKSVMTTLGASNFRQYEREKNDFYATDPKAVEELLKVESFSSKIWECACGTGHISNVLKSHGFDVYSTDLINRGYGDQMDFLNNDITSFDGDIITNPPYKLALDFVKKANDVITIGHKVAMFLKLTFLESKSRKDYFTHTPPNTSMYSLRECVAL